MWKPMLGYFTPGAPLYTEEGGEILKGPRKLDVARRLLAESGYLGVPITLMAAQDIPAFKAWGDVTVDLLKHLDMAVDFVALDFATGGARVLQKSPPHQGGWHMFVTGYSGVECADPTQRFVRAYGDSFANGWASNPQIEAEVAAWYDATSLDEEKMIIRRLNKLALDHVVYAPLGMFLKYFAWHRNVSGIVPAPLPLFWGVSKTA